MTTTARAGLTVLAVLGGSALILRAADAIPGLLASVPRGVHICTSLAEAEARTGLGLAQLRDGLGGYLPVAGGIRAVANPVPTVAVTLRRSGDGENDFTLFRSRAGAISTLVRQPLAAFHEIEVPLAQGRKASLKAASLDTGSVWQDLEWSDGAGHTALRSRGRTVELLRLAKLLGQEAR